MKLSSKMITNKTEELMEAITATLQNDAIRHSCILAKANSSDTRILKDSNLDHQARCSFFAYVVFLLYFSHTRIQYIELQKCLKSQNYILSFFGNERLSYFIKSYS